MAVFRVEKNSNYTSMSNYHLRDTTLTLKAIGLLSKILSLPNDWDYSVRGLVAISKEGKDCIVSVLQELEEHGYLERHQIRKPDGRMGGIEYIIFEQPPRKLQRVEIPCSEKPDAEEPNVEKSSAENPPQLSTDRLSTELINNRKMVSHKYGPYQNVLLTDGEYETLCKEFPYDFEQRIARLSEYMGSTGKVYKNHLITIRSWARREKSKQSQGYSHDMYQFDEGDSL